MGRDSRCEGATLGSVSSSLSLTGEVFSHTNRISWNMQRKAAENVPLKKI